MPPAASHCAWQPPNKARAAVSTRSLKWPSPTGRAPACAKRATSSSVKSPSGPTSRKAGTERPGVSHDSGRSTSAYVARGGAPWAARSASGEGEVAPSLPPWIIPVTSATVVGSATSRWCSRSDCLLAERATRRRRSTRPARTSSEREVRSGRTASAPSSAAFSTKNSARPPWSEPNAAATRKRGPVQGVRATGPCPRTSARPRPASSTCAACTPPRPSQSSTSPPGFSRSVFACPASAGSSQSSPSAAPPAGRPPDPHQNRGARPPCCARARATPPQAPDTPGSAPAIRPPALELSGDWGGRARRSRGGAGGRVSRCVTKCARF